MVETYHVERSLVESSAAIVVGPAEVDWNEASFAETAIVNHAGAVRHAGVVHRAGVGSHAGAVHLAPPCLAAAYLAVPCSGEAPGFDLRFLDSIFDLDLDLFLNKTLAQHCLLRESLLDLDHHLSNTDFSGLFGSSLSVGSLNRNYFDKELGKEHVEWHLGNENFVERRTCTQDMDCSDDLWGSFRSGRNSPR